MLKTITIANDDNLVAKITSFLNKIEYTEHQRSLTSIENALTYLDKFAIDICILEIKSSIAAHMNYYSLLAKKTQLILISDSGENAVDAFHINACDYLLKPLSESRFEQAIEKAKSHLEQRSKSSTEDHIYIRADYSLVKLCINEILFIEGMDDYLKIHLTSGKQIVARCTLKSFSQKLINKNFIRVHRSYIVPLNRINNIKKHSLSIDEKVIPIGSRYLDHFHDTIRLNATA